MRVVIMHQNRHQWHEVDARKRCQRQKSDWQIFATAVQMLFDKVLVRDHFVSIGILPNVMSVKTESGCRARDKCLFPHCKMESSQNRRSEDKSAVAVVKLYHNWVVSQDSETKGLPKSEEKYRGNPRRKVLGSIRRVRFTVYDMSSRNPGKSRTVAWKYSEVPTLWNLRTDLKKRLKGKGDVPAARHGILPQIF